MALAGPTSTAECLDRLSRLLDDPTSVPDTLTQLAATAMAVVAVVDGASVVLQVDGRPATQAATSELVRSADEMHHRYGEPLSVQRIAQLGFQSANYTPLVADNVIIGSINIYSNAADAFDVHAGQLISLLAALTARRIRAALDDAGHQNMKHVAIDGGRAHQVTMLTQVAETTPVGIYLRDKDKMLFMNSAFLSLFGFPPDHDRAAVLRDVRSRVHPDDMEKARTTLIAADGIRSAECELRLKFPDGNDRWIHITNTPVPGAGTGVVRVVGTAQDVTARRNTEADLRESGESENKLVQAQQDAWDAAAEAASANASKSALLSRMSHELRTPLNAVLGFAQILEMALELPAHRKAISYILDGGRHLLELINDVLDFNGIANKTFHLAREPVDIHELILETIELVRPLAAVNDITIDHEYTGSDSTVASVDRRRLGQVMENLLSNAIKYNRTNGRVTVSERVGTDGGITIQVIDTGRGIRQEDLPRLFDAFERLGNHSADVAGVGIGLALSHLLVATLGGRLLVASVHGVGSTFTLELPLVHPPEP